MRSKEILKVKNPALITSIQDEGRIGFRRFALPKSGCLDGDSARLSNFLVGNEPNQPVLEILGNNFSCQALADFSAGICGAEIRVKVNDQNVDHHRTILVKQFDQIEISGSVTYLAINGGILNCQMHFGSASTYPLAKLGGYDGHYLKKGLTIHGNPGKSQLRHLPDEVFPRKDGLIRVIKGPEFDVDISKFENSAWKVSSNSNRVGLRLAPNDLNQNYVEINSIPVFPGTIQLTPDQSLIVLMADAQTTGGYPRIAQVIQADLPRISRLIDGGTIRFKFVEIDEARHILERKNSFIKHALEKQSS